MGLPICLLILVMWATSLFVTVMHTGSPMVCLDDGELTIVARGRFQAGSFSVLPADQDGYGLTWPRVVGSWYFIPFWLPLVTITIPTAILWYRDRRPPKGHCQNCGYDLTGNVTGVCPECGQAT
jgi:hypothetical protein